MRTSRLLVPALAMTFAMGACGDDEDDGTGGSAGAPTSSSSVSSTSGGGGEPSSSSSSTASSASTGGTGGDTGGDGGVGGEAGGAGGTGGNAGGTGGMPMLIENCANGVDDDGDAAIDCADTGCAAAAICGDVVINELDYDQPSVDVAEFIEVLNSGAAAVDLTGLQLIFVNGDPAVKGPYQTLDLSGSLAAGQYLVAHNSGVTPAAGAVTLTYTDGALQNGSPDAVVLYDSVNKAVVDSVSYEGAVLGVTIGGQSYDFVAGTAPTAQDSASGTVSMIRFPNGVDTGNDAADWKATSTLTPGAANVLTEVCGNLADDDGDMLVDCNDPDCIAVCPEDCDNGIDDNGNTLTDCAEASCAGVACDAFGKVCTNASCVCPGGTTETACADNADNDCDGNADCADSDCATAPACVTFSCTDNVLNGSETDVDCGGPDCPDCSAGEMCTIDGDCDTAICEGGVCMLNLFFSEYIEGSSNDKALEIINASAVAGTLENCAIRYYSNGATTPSSTIPLTVTTLAAGDVYTFCNASATFAPTCDQTGNLFINGDDAIDLVCSNVVMDVIGQIGVDPGSEWGTDLTSTLDNTIRRKCSITVGDTNGADPFDPAVEWVGFAIDDVSGLGSAACAP